MRALSFIPPALAVLLWASAAPAQSASGSVTASGHVSGAAFVAVAPGGSPRFTHESPDAHTVRLTIKSRPGSGFRVAVPLRLRSNVGFRLTVTAAAGGEAVRGLCVAGARASGRFVSSAAVEAAGKVKCGGGAAAFPRTLLSGPAISLGGGLDSPSNALELSLLLEIEPAGGVELILSAAPSGTGP